MSWIQVIGVGMVILGWLTVTLWEDSVFSILSYPSQKEGHISVDEDEQDTKINNDLKHTYFKSQLKEMVVGVENDELAPKYDSESLQVVAGVNETQWGVDLRQEGGANQVVEDLEKESKEKTGSQYKTPEQELLSEMAYNEWLREYDEAYSNQFVEKFLDNARKEGYTIQLNEDLEVIKIEKIRMPKAMNIPEYVF